jgi:uncharacterized protein YndB with AHSA1/START domain
MMSTPAPDGTTTLTLRRTFPATRERVFRAWTERGALQQWFRPMGTGLTISKLECFAGGSYRFDLEDGSNAIVGTYIEVVRPEKLVFTWSFTSMQSMDTVVTIEFIEHGSVTEVVLTHDRFSSKEMRDNHDVRWQSLLDQLAEVLSDKLENKAL